MTRPAVSDSPVVSRAHGHGMAPMGTAGQLWWWARHSRAFWLGTAQGWGLIGAVTGNPRALGVAIIAGTLCWLTDWIGS